MPVKPLSMRQRQFVVEYFLTGNGVRSYQRVYGTMNFGTASTAASRALNKPWVQDLLRQFHEDYEAARFRTCSKRCQSRRKEVSRDHAIR